MSENDEIVKLQFKVASNYYAIEGIDGSGKTTLKNVLESNYGKDILSSFKGHYKDIAFLSLPYPQGEEYTKIRQLLKTNNKTIFQQRELMLRLALDQYIINNTFYENPETLFIADRSNISTLVYQSTYFSLSEVYTIIKDQFLPSKVFFLSLDVNEALRRLQNNGKTKEEDFENKKFLTTAEIKYNIITKNLIENSPNFQCMWTSSESDKLIDCAVNFFSNDI
jgi:thymidylate kinase